MANNGGVFTCHQAGMAKVLAMNRHVSHASQYMQGRVALVPPPQLGWWWVSATPVCRAVGGRAGPARRGEGNDQATAEVLGRGLARWGRLGRLRQPLPQGRWGERAVPPESASPRRPGRWSLWATAAADLGPTTLMKAPSSG